MSDFVLNDSDSEVDSDEEVSIFCVLTREFITIQFQTFYLVQFPHEIKNKLFQLQEAFAKGLLKPGLNEEVEREEKKYVNKVADLKAKLREFKLNLPWVETLDLVTTVAPMAPDVAMQMQETAQKRK